MGDIKSAVTGFEAGFLLDVYTRKIEMMPTAKQYSVFLRYTSRYFTGHVNNVLIFSSNCDLCLYLGFLKANTGNMEPKKTEKADLTNKSWLFFNIGLVISLAIVITAFEWKTKDDTDLKIRPKTPTWWKKYWIFRLRNNPATSAQTPATSDHRSTG